MIDNQLSLRSQAALRTGTPMQQLELTSNGILQLLLDPELRHQLSQALVQDSTEYQNQFWKACNECRPNETELRRVFQEVLKSSAPPEHELLGPLIFNENMPDDLLMELCEQGKFISQLSHRRGPKALLEKIAEKYNSDEAITSLALYYYKNESLEDFVNFVQKYKHCWMLQFNLAYKCPEFDPNKASFIRRSGAAQFDRIFQRQDMLRLLREAPSPEAYRICLKGDAEVQHELCVIETLPADILRALASDGKTRAIRNLASQRLKPASRQDDKQAGEQQVTSD